MFETMNVLKLVDPDAFRSFDNLIKEKEELYNKIKNSSFDKYLTTILTKY